MSALVVTVAGIEPPNLISHLASTITAKGGNWQASSISRLSGHIAAIIELTIPNTQELALTEALKMLDGPGMMMQVSGLDDTHCPAPRTLSLDLLGHDQPGIVSQITRILTDNGITIVQMDTECFPGQMSAEPMFHATMELEQIAGHDLEPLRHQLEQIAAELMVELTLQDS